MPELSTPAHAIEAIMAISCLLMGISHMLRKQMWEHFFTHLQGLGTTGVVMRTFSLELWPGLLIVVLHPVWSGPGLVVTLYGWALAGKCTLSMLRPDIGLRSLGMAQKGGHSFLVAGVALCAIAACATWALFT